MTASTVAIIALLVLGWSVVSSLLGRWNVTGPMVFTLAGYLISNPDWGPSPIDVDAASVHAIAEITLALVLFSDAARVNVGQLRGDVWLPVRLLGIGLPLSIILGGLLASVLFGDLSWALAGFIGASLAPTDAALSAQVINDKTVPMRLRRALNVESGLNDGIATPIVSAMLLVAATQIGLESDSEAAQIGSAIKELAGGTGVGLLLGVAGAAAIQFGSRRGWMAVGTRRLAVLAVALSAYILAVDFEFNGFIAAFVAGVALGTTSKAMGVDEEDVERVGELPELGGQGLALVVWFLFGATLLPLAFDQMDLQVVLYALLSLTVVRMLPVALALIRSGLDTPSVLFVGWFGPRGLASVVFALLAIEELGENTPVVGQAVAAVAMTVLASVVLHGITAGPWGRRFVQIEAQAESADQGPPPRAGGIFHRHQRGDSSEAVSPGAD